MTVSIRLNSVTAAAHRERRGAALAAGVAILAAGETRSRRESRLPPPVGNSRQTGKSSATTFAA